MALAIALLAADSRHPAPDTVAGPAMRPVAAGTTPTPAAGTTPTPAATTPTPTGTTPAGAPTAELPPPPPPEPAPALVAGPVNVKVDGFLSWALLDRAADSVAGSKNLTATSTSESVIKIWLAADFLRRTAEARRQPGESRLRQARLAIRDSDDGAAQNLYRAGGGNAAVDRMISRCRLTDTDRFDDSWSQTRMSARDVARLGDCVADGTAAGPRWTRWIMTEMTRVRGTTAARDQPSGGRWGIIDALPAELREQGVSMKNGWTLRATGQWHVNCLAVTPDRALAVLTRYPAGKGLAYGAKVCAEVTRQLVSDPG
jgi:hypothetical protein